MSWVECSVVESTLVCSIVWLLPQPALMNHALSHSSTCNLLIVSFLIHWSKPPKGFWVLSTFKRLLCVLGSHIRITASLDQDKSLRNSNWGDSPYPCHVFKSVIGIQGCQNSRLWQSKLSESDISERVAAAIWCWWMVAGGKEESFEAICLISKSKAESFNSLTSTLVSRRLYYAHVVNVILKAEICGINRFASEFVWPLCRRVSWLKV